MADMKYDIDSSDIVRTRKEIRAWSRDNADAFSRVNSRMQTFGKTSDLAFNQFGRAATRAHQKSKRFASVGLQQAGYQVGDFAVQVQGGTSAMVALGQQGSQLAGIFGPGGAVLGAVLAIGTAIANVWLETNKARQSMKEFKDNLEAARETVKGMADDLKLLRSGFEDAFEATLVDQVERAEKKLREAREALAAAPQASPDRSASAARQRAREEAEEAVRLAERELLSARELVRQQKEEARNASIANQLYEARLIIREREKEVAEAIRKGMAANIGFTKTLQNETAKYVENMSGVFKNTQKLREELGEAAFEALRLSGVNLETGVDKAAKAAARLAAQLKISFAEAMKMAKLGTDLGGGTYEYDAATGKYRLKGTSAGDPFGNLGYDTGGSSSLGGDTSLGSSGGGGGGSIQSDPRAFLESLQRELDLKRLLVGVNDETAERLKLEARLKEELLETGGKITEQDRSRIESLVKQAEAIRQAEAAEERRRANIERFEQQMSDSITNIVTEAKTIEDAFIGVIRNIVAELFKQNVADPISTGIGDFVGGLFGGGGSSKPNLLNIAAGFTGAKPFAKGGAFTNGVVDKPTMFPMGQMGEAGPEAIMPLSRGKNGKLGVSAEGGSGGGNVTIHQSFNFVANGDESVKRIIQQEAPKISAMTEKQIINSRRRGGALKTAFG